MGNTDFYTLKSTDADVRPSLRVKCKGAGENAKGMDVQEGSRIWLERRTPRREG